MFGFETCLKHALNHMFHNLVQAQENMPEGVNVSQLSRLVMT